MTPEEFGAFIHAELARYRALAREHRIVLDN